MDIPSALSAVEAAGREKKLSPGSVENIHLWLTAPRYAEYVPLVVEHVADGKWKQLDDVFFTTIPFGTGGRRGAMYPIGSNAVNEATIGESAQGLADYVKQHREDEGELACAIAYDTRHRSREFAQLCSEVMVAAGFQVYFLDGYRSTPALSFAVRHKRCSCGIMVTASHNPPSDNAVKVYWSTGGQLLPPHDRGVIEAVESVEKIRRVPFDEALAAGKVVYCQDEVDQAYLDAVLAQRCDGPRDLKIIYTPLHGVGTSAVKPALERDGFSDLEIFGPHAEPSGDFPNVPGHVANPENPAVFDAPVARAKEIGADLVMATDPDCDRLGVAAPKTLDPGSEWATLTGNQIGGLLTEFVLERRKQACTLTPDHYIIETLVTTALMRRIAEAYGVRVYSNLLVGFKYIAGMMDDLGPERFVFGGEESHGYLAGQHVRDKDGVVATMLFAELAAQLKAQGQSVHEKLDALFWQYGCHAERLVNVMMPGAEGMQAMNRLMVELRNSPPNELAGLKVARLRDYQSGLETVPGRAPWPFWGPQGDMVMLDLAADGTYVAVRPSGTEPKVKFYMFTYEPPETIADLEDTKRQLDQRLDHLEADLRAVAV